MGTEKFIAFKEDGSAYRLKGRILRFLDNEPVSEADKTNIRSTLSVPASAEGLTPANNLSDLDNAATARTNLSVNSIDEDAQANGTKVTAPALYFNGSSSNVIIAADSKLVPTDGTNDTAFSGACWVKADDLTTCPLFGIYGTSAAARNYRFNIDGSDKLTLLLIDTGGHSAFAVSNTAVTAYEGKWVHFAFTYGGSDSGSFGSAANQIALYINGSAVAVTPTNDNGGTYDGMTDGTNPLWIGRFDNSYKKSSIRDVKVFNRELTSTEVAELARGNDLGFSDEWAGANGGVYSSDFSAGVDEWAATNGTADGNIDSIGGQDDNLRLTVNTASSTHFLYLTPPLTVGRRYRVSLDYYLPSGQSNVDGLTIGTDITAANFIEITSGTTDSWTRVDAEAIANGPMIRVFATDAGGRTFQDAGGDDVLYIRNVTITEIGALADFRSERYDTSTNKLYDLSDNAFVGTGTSVTLTGLEVPVYETGTWTPSITFGGGSTGITYGTQEGYYTRVGNHVTIWGRIVLTSKGSDTGNTLIVGAPYSAVTLSATSMPMTIGKIGNMSGLTGSPIASMTNAASTVTLNQFNATGVGTITDANFTNTSTIAFSGTYQIQ